jgi:CRISPR-associated protein Csm3
MSDIIMLGRVQVAGRITLRSGLHIGAGNDSVEIGGIDNPVIKHPHSGEPYIPGSSLKGKLRFLLEWAFGTVRADGKPWGADDREENATPSDADPILRIFGNALKAWRAGPTRLLMEDCPLAPDWVKETLGAGRALTEEKTEVLIDRIQGKAHDQVGPRQTERVPAGAAFEFGFAFRLFDTGDGGARDRACLNWLLQGLDLLEQDALGGSGSRGYGRIRFDGLQIREDGRDWQALDNAFRGHPFRREAPAKIWPVP